MSRESRDGVLEVDEGFETVPLSSQGQSHTVEVTAPYYIGGMTADVADNAKHNLQVLVMSTSAGAFQQLGNHCGDDCPLCNWFLLVIITTTTTTSY